MDIDAQVLIAGAAGGSEKFLDFYQQVLADDAAKESFDIGNIHCISNDEYQNFNVVPYKKMLDKLGVSKPIWVTEAEAIISDDADVNATQTYESTKNALSAGVKKIFYTNYKFANQSDQPKPLETDNVGVAQELSGKTNEEVYQFIFEKNQ